MHSSGIIAEYNPFHNGHLWHISQIKKLSEGPVVVVMSGNFVQRGEPALISKHKRAEMALYGGADLVLELPLPWAVSSAEAFARGGIAILGGLGCVNNLSFGCESENAAELHTLASALLCREYDTAVHKLLETGETFARLRIKALEQLGYDASPLLTPNNTLAVEYLKSNISLNTNLNPIAIQRHGAAHDSAAPADGVCSASYIRTKLSSPELSCYMPEKAHNILCEEIKNGRAPASFAALERGLLTVLRRMTPEDISELPDLSEGLHNRLYSAIQSSCSVQEIMYKVKTKRYTMSRIRRLLISAYLGIPAGLAKSLPPYIRVLGFTKEGKEILSRARHTASLPIIMRYADIRKADSFAQEVFALECRASDLYGLAVPNIQQCAREQTASPIQI